MGIGCGPMVRRDPGLQIRCKLHATWWTERCRLICRVRLPMSLWRQGFGRTVLELRAAQQGAWQRENGADDEPPRLTRCRGLRPAPHQESCPTQKTSA